jgi:5-methyltetrahydropteroyltriglutamate--homocysteine methyltransferase
VAEPAAEADVPAALPVSTARLEHIGALARPARLTAGVRAHAEGRLAAQSLGALEDLAVFDSLWEQDTAGLDVFTDGQFRRPVGPDAPPAPGAVAAEAAFLHEHAPGLFKVALPSPSVQALTALFTDESHLATPDRLLRARAGSVAAELSGAVVTGARYVELVADRYCLFLDPFVRTSWRAWGIDPTRLLGLAVEADAACVERLRLVGATVAVRLCPALLYGGRLGAVPRPLAAALLESLPYDRLLADLEPDRPAPLESLRAVPPGRSVVLGVVGTGATARLPAYDRLARLLDSVTATVPADALAVGTVAPPACAGRLSTSRPAERRALDLVARLARDAWGSRPAALQPAAEPLRPLHRQAESARPAPPAHE